MDKLYQAIEEKNPIRLRLLINLGYNIHLRYWGKQTLMHLAANTGCLECTKLLLENGLDVNIRDGSGSTPLHRAVFARDNFEMIKFLLEQGAEVNARDNFGRTPIQDCLNDEVRVYQLLINYGADVTVVDNKGNVFLDWVENLGPASDKAKHVIEKHLLKQIINILKQE